MLLYNVEYYSPNGKPQASCDSSVPDRYVHGSVVRMCAQDGCYAKAININSDGHSVWIGPGGEIIRPPWEEAAREREARERRKVARKQASVLAGDTCLVIGPYQITFDPKRHEVRFVTEGSVRPLSEDDVCAAADDWSDQPDSPQALIYGPVAALIRLGRERRANARAREENCL